MKLIILIMLLPCMAIGQRIRQDGVDKFTKQHIKESSEERIWMNWLLSTSIDIKIRETANTRTLFLDMVESTPVGIAEGQKLYLLLSNDSSIILNCIKGDISNCLSIKYHRYQSNTVYIVPNDYFDMLKAYPLKSIRVELAGSLYIDHEIKDRYQNVLSELLKLF